MLQSLRKSVLRAINLRLTEEDQRVIDLIRNQHPLIGSDANVLRLALECYWQTYGPEAKPSEKREREKEMYRMIKELHEEVVAGDSRHY